MVEKKRRNNKYSRFANKYQEKAKAHFKKRKRLYCFILLAIVLLLLLVILVLATYKFFKKDYPKKGRTWEDFLTGYGWLLLLYVFFTLILLYVYVFEPFCKKKCLEKTAACRRSCMSCYKNKMTQLVLVVLFFFMLVGMVVFVALLDVKRIVSFAGIFMCVICGMVLSKQPRSINVKQIVIFYIIAFLMGLIFVWHDWTASHLYHNRLTSMITNSLDASSYVYTESITTSDYTFSFTYLSSLFFIAFITHILYYYRVFQKTIETIGIGVEFCTDLTVVETAGVLLNVGFLNCEVLMMLWPYIGVLTESEIHQLMASNFASLNAIFILTLDVNLNIDLHHVIVSSLVSGPATVMFAKLIFPETIESNTHSKDTTRPTLEAYNWFDAGFRGACFCTRLVMYVAACVCAFVCIVYFLDQLFNWYFMLIGYEDVTLVVAFSYLFWIPAFLMGVEYNEALVAGEVLASRIINGEYEAFQLLQDYGDEDSISARSRTVVMYAISGAASVPTVAATIATMYYLSPRKKVVILETILWAWLSGLIGCYISACIANFFIE